jgi:hypothetical protein
LILENKTNTRKKEGKEMIAVSSLFSQILSHVSRNDFATLVAKHSAEHKAKGFTCWEQFVAMLFSPLAQADSLREICNGLRCCLGKIKHLGTDKAYQQVNTRLRQPASSGGIFRGSFLRHLPTPYQGGRLRMP